MGFDIFDEPLFIRLKVYYTIYHTTILVFTKIRMNIKRCRKIGAFIIGFKQRLWRTIVAQSIPLWS